MLTQQLLDDVFTKLRILHKAHWKVPLLAEVEKEITRSGAYVFRIGAAPWVAEVCITHTLIQYEVNRELPVRMLNQTLALKKLFDEQHPMLH